MYLVAHDRLGPGRALAVGDRLDTDVAGARRAGIDRRWCCPAPLARRGRRAAPSRRPTLVADSLAALVAVTRGAWRRPMARRPVCLIVNPAPAAGRAARAPARRGGAARARAALPRRAHARRSRTRASWRARRRATRARSPPRSAATGCRRGRRRAARRPRRRCSASSRAAAATTSRASSASPRDPAGAPATCSRTARERAIDVGDAGGATFLGIASAAASTPTSNRHRERDARSRSASRLRLRRAARARRLAAGALRASSSTASARDVHAATRVAVANSGVFGGGMRLAPDARARRRPARRRDDRATRPSAASCAALPRVFQGTHVDDPSARRSLRGARDRVRRRPPVRALRRRRPDRRPAGRPSASRPRALRVLVP